MAERVEVLGLDKVLKNLKGLEDDLKRKALLSGARKGANKFKRTIVSKTPTDTGSLKKAITTKQMGKALKDVIGAMVVIKTKLTKSQRKKLKNSRDPWYWFLQEYGWFAGGKWRTKANKGLTRAGFRAKNKKTRTKKEGLFFVKNSYNQNKDRIASEYETEIAKSIEKYRGG